MAPDNPGSSTTSPASRLQIYRHSPSPAKPRADTARLVRDTVNELPKSTPKLLSAPSAPALRPAKPTPKPLSAKRSLRELQTAWIKIHAQTSPSTGTQKTRDMSQPAHHTFLPASPPPAISSAPSRGKGVESKYILYLPYPELKHLRPNMVPQYQMGRVAPRLNLSLRENDQGVLAMCRSTEPRR